VSLLRATTLFRRIFPNSVLSSAGGVSILLSPPPSPSRTNSGLHLELRTRGSKVFDCVDDFDGGKEGGCDEIKKEESLGIALEEARSGGGYVGECCVARKGTW
jgi:hypothetical protein